MRHTTIRDEFVYWISVPGLQRIAGIATLLWMGVLWIWHPNSPGQVVLGALFAVQTVLATLLMDELSQLNRLIREARHE